MNQLITILGRYINILLIVFIFLISGCQVYQYNANPVTVPLFSEKGNAEATISVNNGIFNENIAYAFSNHFLAFCNASFYYKTYGPSEPLMGSTNKYLYHSNKEITGGIGYYYKKNTTHYEILGGFGYCDDIYKHVEFQYSDGSGDNDTFSYTAYQYIYFIQPNYGIELGENSKFALSAKFSLKNYNFTEWIKNNVMSIDYKGRDFSPESKKQNIYFIEPAITYRKGSRKIQFQVQAVSPIVISNNDIYIKRVSIFFGIILNMDIPKKHN